VPGSWAVPGPAAGAYSAPPGPLAGFKGRVGAPREGSGQRGRGRRKEGRERGSEGREGKVKRGKGCPIFFANNVGNPMQLA